MEQVDPRGSSGTLLWSDLKSTATRTHNIGTFALLTILGSSALGSLPLVPHLNAVGAPCPAGSNLYPASILSAIVTYQDAYTQQAVSIDIVQHPNATLNVEFDSSSGTAPFPIYSSSITFSTVAESDLLNNATGAVNNAGLNGDSDYQACISPVEADTTYTIPIPIDHPASDENYSHIVDDIGGPAVEFWIHWVYPDDGTSSKSTSTTSAVEFPSNSLPLLLSASVIVAALAARCLKATTA